MLLYPWKSITGIQSKVMQDRYLIVSETKRKGYILEEHDSFESAQERAEFFVDLMAKKFLLKVDLSDLFNPLASYKHHEQIALYKDSVWLCSDGFDSVYILKVPFGFRFDFFIKCRSSHQYAVNFWKNSEQIIDINNRREIYFDAMAN